MECDQTVRASATRERPHATLVESSEDCLDQDQLIVVGSCLTGRAVERSALLSGIGNTAGLAVLPSQLSPEEMKLWETAHNVDMDMLPADLVTVLKVADALSDENSTTWATKLAGMALATFQQPGSSECEAMLTALLRLPLHLLHRVLSACLSQASLSETLLTFPSPLQPALVSAAAADTCGALCFTHEVASTVLTLLPLTAVRDPGLVFLLIASKSPVCSPMSTGALLGRTATAHPSLMHLCLDAPPLPPAWLRSVSDCLSRGAWPHLSNLDLCVDAYPGGYAEVATCLALLPSLQCLTLSFHLPDQSVTATEPLAAYTRLTAAPASLPHLRSLDFQEAEIFHTHSPDREQIDMRARYSSQRSRAHSFLSVLNAPALTHLVLTLHTARPRLGTLLPQLLRFTALEDIEIIAAFQTRELQTSERQLPCGEGAVSAALPALKSVNVDSSCPASRAALCAAIATQATSSLTAVDLSSVYLNPYPNPCSAEESHSAWQRFGAVLGECTRVQRLDFRQGLFELPPAMRGDCSRSLSSALERLTRLTHLKVEPEPDDCVALNGQELGRALSKLVALESLTIDRGLGALEFDVVEPVTRACAALTRVTYLRLCFDGITQELVTDFPQRLVSLRRLEFGEGVFGPGELAAFTARFKDVAVGIA